MLENNKSSELSNNSGAAKIIVPEVKIAQEPASNPNSRSTRQNPGRSPFAPLPPNVSFVGREAELVALKNALSSNQNSQTSLVSIQGTGGIGKTTLARQLAYELYQPDSKDGFHAVLWVEVKPRPDPWSYLRQWASYCGIKIDYGQTDWDKIAVSIKTELGRLMTGRTLVVFDDVWSDGIETVRQLLKAVPAGASVLITGRDRRVSVALSARPTSLQTLPTTESVALLREYLDDKNLAQSELEKLAEVLGGHTLALTLAAKRLNTEVNVRTALARHLTQYTQGLPNGSAMARLKLTDNTTLREDNLTLTLAYSYDVLTEAQQSRFRALGALIYDQPFDLILLAGLWQVSTAESVNNEPDIVEDKTREWASELLHLSLLQQATEIELGDGWYRQHPLLHSYALALLKADYAEYVANRNRYNDQVIEITSQFDKIPPEEWGRLDPYLPHIHATGDTLVALTTTASPIKDETTLRRALAFAINITTYLAERQEVHKLEWLKMGLEAARAFQDRDREKLFLHQLGVYNARNNWLKALEYYEHSLSIAKELNDLKSEAITLAAMSGVYSDLGEKTRALKLYEVALPLIRQMSDQSFEATLLNNMGLVYSDLGEKTRALELYEQALPLRRQVGDRGGEATTLSNIGSIYDDLGDKERALELYAQALPLQRQIGDRSGEANTLSNMAKVYSDLGDKKQALELYEQALFLVHQVGNRGSEANTLTNLGMVYSGLGDKERALELYAQALPLQRQIGDRSGEAVTLNNIGGIYSDLGDKERALEFYAQALPVRRQVGDRYGEAATLNNMGLTLWAMGRREDGLQLVESAQALFEAVRSPNAQVVAGYLAQMRKALGQDKHLS